MAILAFSGAETGQIFEGGVGEDHWGWEVLGEPYRSEAIRVVSFPSRAGNNAIRIYWDQSWPWFGNNKLRTELKRPNNMAHFTPGNIYWIGFSVYIADTANNRAAVAAGRNNQSIQQIHQLNGTSTSQLMARNNQWEISCPTGPKQYIGTVEFDTWTDFVYYYKCETNGTGRFKVWRNAASSSETPVYDPGDRQTMWTNDQGYFKMGIYREKYYAPGVTYYEQFYDEIRIGNSAESFDTIKPTSAGGFNLGAEDVEAATEVTSPSIGQTHVILADDVSSVSEVSVPVLGQSGVQVLFAEDVESQAELSVPTLIDNQAQEDVTLENIWIAGGDTTQPLTATVTPSGQTPGNLLIGVFIERNGHTDSILSASASWDARESYAGANAAILGAMYTRVATGDSDDTLTLTWGQARRYILVVFEYSGFTASPIEDTAIQTPGNQLYTNTSVSTGSATATTAAGAYVAILALHNWDIDTSIATGVLDYEYEAEIADANIAGVSVAHFNYSTSGAKSDTWSFADNNAIGFIVAGPTLTSHNLFAESIESVSEVSNPAINASSTSYLYPDADSSIGNWTDQAGGTTDIYQAIDETEASDTDYVKSESNPSSSAFKVRLSNPGTAPDSSGRHEIAYRYRKNSNGNQQINLTVKLVEGASTVIATWSHTDIGTTVTAAQQNLSTGEVSSISDYDDLFLEFTASAV